MGLEAYFPVWGQLNAEEQALVLSSATERTAKKGTVLHNGSADCEGLFVIRSGQLRAFILSEEGKEVTVYRLFERDICLFSASCIMNSLQFEITIEAEKDAEMWVIPAEIYRRLMDRSLAVANYTNQVMASRLTDVMWLIEQVMWKSFDRRLAAFLIEESVLNGGDVILITHDKIAAHMGTAREVVTRMLRYFQAEGMVALNRGTVELKDRKQLQTLAK